MSSFIQHRLISYYAKFIFHFLFSLSGNSFGAMYPEVLFP